MPGFQKLENQFHGFTLVEFDEAWFDLEAPRAWELGQPVKTSLARWLVANVRSTERVKNDDPNALIVKFVDEKGITLEIIWGWTSFTTRSRLDTFGQYKYWFTEAAAILKLEKGARVIEVRLGRAVWYPPERK